MLTEIITALGPSDPDDGPEGRQRRGMAIAAMTKIEWNRVGYKVPSQSGNGSYVVSLEDSPFCTCPDFETRQRPCKHIYAVEYSLQREIKADGTETHSESVRVSYTQHWTAYNQAQTNEHDHFIQLLRDLCEGIPQPPQTNGRPRLPLADVVFGLAYKTYGTMSGRRSASALRNACAEGLVEKAGHYNSLFRYLENPALTFLLKELVPESAAPLSVIESDFAADSTGFATSTYARWFDHKWGKVRTEAKFIKTHIMTGVMTNIITAIEATPNQSADNKQFPYLVNETAKRFTMREVSGDKAYSGRVNLHAAEAVGATPYIPFHSHATGRTSGKHPKPDGLWQRMWYYYNYHRAEFLTHYHKRSNAETTFSMMKGKFGSAVRAKSPVGQVNEVLLKALCHNLVVLVQSIYELGIQPEFWAFEADRTPAPKALQKVGL